MFEAVRRIPRKLRLTAAALAGVTAALLLLALAFRPPGVPADAIQKSVIRSPKLIEEAWRLPAAASFGARLSWQSNPSVCGPASLANIFRSLGHKTATESSVLEGSGKCEWGFCFMGLTLDELAEVSAGKTKGRVSVLRDLTPEQFLFHLRRSNDPRYRYAINFLRAPIFGAGAGHHSPVGGYLEARDLVFVLDVNRDFQPWLVERERLYEAMNTMDGTKKRGLLLIEPEP